MIKDDKWREECRACIRDGIVSAIDEVLQTNEHRFNESFEYKPLHKEFWRVLQPKLSTRDTEINAHAQSIFDSLVCLFASVECI